MHRILWETGVPSSGNLLADNAAVFFNALPARASRRGAVHD